jgi:hypothetical protein
VNLNRRGRDVHYHAPVVKANVHCDMLPVRYGYERAQWACRSLNIKPSFLEMIAALASFKHQHWTWTTVTQHRASAAVISNTMQLAHAHGQALLNPG